MKQILLKARLCLAAILFTCTAAAEAQSCGMIGLRVIKGYWIESNVAVVIRPVQNFANPSGCTKTDMAFVSASHPAYKSMLAAVMQAMASGAPLQGYTCGCKAYWGSDTWPLIDSLGVGDSL